MASTGNKSLKLKGALNWLYIRIEKKLINAFVQNVTTVFSILQMDLIHRFNTTAATLLVRAEELIQTRYVQPSVTKVSTMSAILTTSPK